MKRLLVLLALVSTTGCRVDKHPNVLFGGLFGAMGGGAAYLGSHRSCDETYTGDAPCSTSRDLTWVGAGFAVGALFGMIFYQLVKAESEAKRAAAADDDGGGYTPPDPDPAPAEDPEPAPAE